jgi:hypothetical protein
MTSTWQQTSSSTQTVAAYPVSVDGNFAVATRVADAFAPHAQPTPTMTVALDPGFIFDPQSASLATIAAQNSSTLPAPVSQPRIDRIVIDAGTGAVSVVPGIEAASPVPPQLSSGMLPVAQVLLQTGSTAITGGMITDERAVWGAPVPGVSWAIAAGGSDAITASYAPANAALYDGLLLGFRASAANVMAAPSFAPDGLTAHPITKKGGQALVAGDIAGSLAECLIRYNAANTRWELLNPQSAFTLPAIANNDVFANTSGAAAQPVGTPLSALIDSAIGSTRGALLERGANGWTLLAPGTSGSALLSNGVGADPVYGPVAKPGDKVSEFTNDAGYVTGTVARPGDNVSEFVNNAGYVIGPVARPGDDVSEFTNDAGYVTGTVARPGDNISEFNNDVGYITQSSIGIGFSTLYSYGAFGFQDSNLVPGQITGAAGAPGTWECMGQSGIYFQPCETVIVYLLQRIA